MVAPELQLPENEADLFQAIFRVAPGAMAVSHLESGRFIEVNDQMCRLYGWGRKEMLGRTSVELGFWADPSERQKLVDVLRRDGKVRDLELRLRRRHGDERTVLTSIDVVEYGGQSWMLSSNYDITDRKRMEAELREASSYRSAVLDAQSQLGLGVATQLDGRFVDANDAFQRIVGRTLHELRAMEDPALLAAPEHREASRERIRRRAASDYSQVRFDTVFERPDGTRVDAEVATTPFEHAGATRTLVVARDVTARKHAEAALAAARDELARQERLASLGTLIMGVAHEVNNPLHILRMHAEITQLHAEKLGREDLAQLQERSIVAIDRLARVAQGLLAVTRGESRLAARERRDANALVERALEKVPTDARARVRTTLHATAQVESDDDALVVVLRTLLDNALDASRGAADKTVTLRTRDATAHVVLEVEDHGAGIKKEDAPRIFTPFYTTKADGLGLALATAYRIVADHGGQLTFESAPGRTVFRVQLPRAQ